MPARHAVLPGLRGCQARLGAWQGLSLALVPYEHCHAWLLSTRSYASVDFTEGVPVAHLWAVGALVVHCGRVRAVTTVPCAACAAQGVGAEHLPLDHQRTGNALYLRQKFTRVRERRGGVGWGSHGVERGEQKLRIETQASGAGAVWMSGMA